jgi:hypothetical protein
VLQFHGDSKRLDPAQRQKAVTTQKSSVRAWLSIISEPDALHAAAHGQSGLRIYGKIRFHITKLGCFDL